MMIPDSSTEGLTEASNSLLSNHPTIPFSISEGAFILLIIKFYFKVESK